jgi:hypothetical protein
MDVGLPFIWLFTCLLRGLRTVAPNCQKRRKQEALGYVSIKPDRSTLRICHLSYSLKDGFGGLVVSMPASGSQVRGLKPGRSLWIFQM